MARRLLPDEVWQLVEPLLPKPPPRPKGGRPLIHDRDVLTGILFMLKTGVAWEDLPSEMGCGCGMTCLRRLRDWQQRGIWQRIQRVLQVHLPDARRIDWSRAYGRGSATRLSSHGEPHLHDPDQPVVQPSGPKTPISTELENQTGQAVRLTASMPWPDQAAASSPRG